MLKILIFFCTCLVGSISGLLTLNKSFLNFDTGFHKPQTITWSGGDFIWPCDSTKKMFKSSGKYLSKNVIATRGQMYGDEIFLALPRYRSGIPATLVRMSIKCSTCEPQLIPFPSWEMQEEGKCDALQSVVDIFLDHNNILWVLDTGVVNTLETPLRRCTPKIIAFSANTGNILKTITLEGLLTNSSRLQYIVADYSADGRCFIYISDAANRAIIVYDVQASRGFRIVLPVAITHGCTKRDVLYLTLACKPDKSTVLYFTYLGSKNLFSIKTEYLQNGDCKGHIKDVGCKPKKIVLIGTDNGLALFFRYEGEHEIYRWDTETDFDLNNFKMVHKSMACQLATHALTDYKCMRLRVLESNFQDYIQGFVGCGAIQQISLIEGGM